VAESAALRDPAPEPTNGTAGRERLALLAFVGTAIVASVSWLVLLAWLVVVGLRALGV
jgi:hypothetical protein